MCNFFAALSHKSTIRRNPDYTIKRLVRQVRERRFGVLPKKGTGSVGFLGISEEGRLTGCAENDIIEQIKPLRQLRKRKD